MKALVQNKNLVYSRSLKLDTFVLNPRYCSKHVRFQILVVGISFVEIHATTRIRNHVSLTYEMFFLYLGSMIYSIV
jgi:hypothetical protein